MNIKPERFKYAAILFAGISTASTPTMVNADWSIVALDTISSNFTSIPASINDSGQIVGIAITPNAGKVHAFITGPDGVGITDLYTLSGIEQAYDINNSGQVAGVTRISSEILHAIITGPDGVGIKDLGTFDSLRSFALGINDSGQVIGGFQTPGIEEHAFLTGPNGVGSTVLGTLGGQGNQASGINASGQVTGTSGFPVNFAHAYITGADGVGMKDVGTLFLTSYARGINDAGQVVGFSDVADSTNHAFGAYHAFVTGPDGASMTDLGTLGGNFSQSVAINNLGEVVGAAESASDPGNWHSFIYSHGGMTDLSLLAPVVTAGWSNLFVADINNNGQIIGSGMLNGEHAGFLLSYTPDTLFTPNPIFIPPPVITPPPPIPEPETYMMLLAGLGLVGFIARRKRDSAL